MSSPVRLLLLSGVPGADTGSVAASSFDKLTRAGQVATLIRPGDAATEVASGSLWSLLAQGVGSILLSLGVARLSIEEVERCP